ncbi:MAG: MFS transporter [Thermoplasmata archaeon]|nr:MFS transporter [Thermoplasmata archaeon]
MAKFFHGIYYGLPLPKPQWREQSTRSLLFKDYDVRFKVLFFGRLFAAMGWSVSMPFLAIYMSETLLIDPGIVALTYTVAALFGALSQIIAGELADRIGRRVTMVFAMSVRVAIFILIAAAVHFQLGFMPLAILMTASSITGNTFHPAANAMITDIVPPSRRVEGFSLNRVGINIGWAVGPAMGGISSQFLSYSITFMLTAVLSAITLVMIIIYVKESCPTGAVEKFKLRNVLEIRKDRNFIIYSLFTVFASIIAMQMVSTLSMYSQRYTEITEAELGGLFALNGVLVVFLQFPVSRALSKYRLTTLLAVGTILYCVGYLSVSFFTTFALLLVSMTIVTLGEIVSSPPAMALVGNMAPSTRRGEYMGVFGLFESMGGSFGPLIGGIAIDSFPTMPIMIWTIPCLFGLVAAVGFIILGKRLKKETDTGSL